MTNQPAPTLLEWTTLLDFSKILLKEIEEEVQHCVCILDDSPIDRLEAAILLSHLGKATSILSILQETIGDIRE